MKAGEAAGGEAAHDERLAVEAFDPEVRETRARGPEAHDRGVLGLDLEAEPVPVGLGGRGREEEGALADADLHLDGGDAPEDGGEVDDARILRLARQEDPRRGDPAEVPRAGGARRTWRGLDPPRGAAPAGWTA